MNGDKRGFCQHGAWAIIRTKSSEWGFKNVELCDQGKSSLLKGQMIRWISCNKTKKFLIFQFYFCPSDFIVSCRNAKNPFISEKKIFCSKKILDAVVEDYFPLSLYLKNWKLLVIQISLIQSSVEKLLVRSILAAIT